MPMNKKRLLIFHPAIAPYRIDLFNDLAQSFDTRICLQMRNLLNQKFDYTKIESLFKFKPIYLNQIATIHGRMVCSGYWKQLRLFKPDIVIVSEFGIDAITAIIYRKLTHSNFKIISICDDSYNMIVENNDFSSVHRKLRNIITPFLDELILVNPDVTKWYNQNFHKGYFFPIIANDNRIRKLYEEALPTSRLNILKYNLKGKKIFLFVGRLVKIKNVSTILEAYRIANIDNSALIIIGDGPEKKELIKQAKRLNINAIFAGRLEGTELYSWYNISDCFILPSTLEPFGAVTNEALIGGCMALVSQNAGSNCLIKENENGSIFDPTNIQELASKMTHIVQNTIVNDGSSLRNNKMHISYSVASKKLIQHLNNIAK